MLRKKETQKDYRYFPEPNLPAFHLDKNWIQDIIDKRPLYPEEILDLLKEQGIPDQQAQSLLGQKDLTDFYFAVIKYTERKKDVLHILLSDVRNWIKTNEVSLCDIDPVAFAWVIDQRAENFSMSKIREWIFDLLKGKDIKKEVERALRQRPDLHMIENWIEQVCQNNQKSIDDYRHGKKRALSYLVGQVIKCSKGQADPIDVEKRLREKLK